MTTQEHVLSEIKKILKEERMKNEIQYKIGTSSEGFMGREEDKQLTYHFKELQNELTKTNIHSLNENINGNHLSNLYEIGKDEYKWPEFNYNEQYQQQVFNLLSFSPFAKSTAPVSDFLKQYILLENKIKMKKEEAEDVYHQLRKASQENEDQLNKYSSLPYKDNSIQLGVAIFEVSNLKINDNNNLYVIKLTVDNHLPNTTNASPCLNNTIIYNQNYQFDLKQRNLTLKVELLRQNTLRTFTPFATCLISLEEIDPEQQRVENVFDLYSVEHPAQNISVGQIRLKLHYVYDKEKYFKTLVNKTKNDYELTMTCLRGLSKASELMDKPFGLIMTNEISVVKEIISENNIYNKVSHINPAVRLSVIHTQGGLSAYKDRTSNELINVTISKDESVKSNLIISNVLLYICLCLSGYCCTIRNDILNLLTFAFIWFMQHVQENIPIINYIKWMLVYTEISDVLWILAKIAKYVQLKEEEVKYATFLRGSVFIAGLVNLCIKVKIIIACFKRRK